jgi:uncharacterized protein with HEPN domain
MHRSKELFVEDIKESIDAIFEYLVDVDFNEFKKDRKTYQAVIREFEIIGEATKHIFDEAKACCPEIRWRSIIDFRNKINHEYFGINFKIIWDTIFYELPKLKEAIEKLKKEI